MTDLASLEAAARERLDPAAYAYFAGGAGDRVTLGDAAPAWARVRLRPRVLRDVAGVTTATTVLGTSVASPVLAAPVALLSLAHDEAEGGWAAGVAGAGSLPVLSSRTTTPIAEVAAALGAGTPWWFQVYVLRDRGLTAELVRRAAAAGARALVLTGDTPVLSHRERVALPAERLVPDLPGAPRDALRQDPATTFDDVAWLREVSGGLPVVVKGVLRGDDARACAAAGAAGVVVSNHGGRQLDGAVSTADALPEVAAALAAGGVELYADGGVRSGIDVLRALALGARAVLVGRPLVWALAAGGGDGVRGWLAQLRAEVAEALALAGVSSPCEAAEAGLVAVNTP